MNKTKILISLLIILASFVRIIILLSSDNFGGSVPMGRVAAALCIVEVPRLSMNFDGNTSILFNYLLAAVLKIWPDPTVAPRIFSMLFGILLIIPFYFLIKMLFNENIALYSTVILSFYSLHAIQSTISISDVIYHFFFFSSLFYFFKFKFKEKKISWLILSAFLFNIASMLRFESWIFIPLLAVLLYENGKRYAVNFFLLCLILPVLWLYLCYRYSGMAFYSFITAARTAQAEILLREGLDTKEIFGWLRLLYHTLGQVVMICSMGGLLYSLLKRRFLYLALFFLYLYFFYTINILSKKMWYVDRYTIFLGLLLIPYSVLCIERIAFFFKLKPIILILPFIFLSIIQLQKITFSNLPLLPEGIREVADWLKQNTLPEDKFILSSDKWDESDQDIIVRSGISPKKFLVVATPLVYSKSVTKESIKEYIANVKPTSLILNSTGFLQKVLNFDMTKEIVEEFGYTFKLIYSLDTPGMGRFNIYKIYY